MTLFPPLRTGRGLALAAAILAAVVASILLEVGVSSATDSHRWIATHCPSAVASVDVRCSDPDGGGLVIAAGILLTALGVGTAGAALVADEISRGAGTPDPPATSPGPASGS